MNKSMEIWIRMTHHYYILLIQFMRGYKLGLIE
jgi:hypothetical protein